MSEFDAKTIKILDSTLIIYHKFKMNHYFNSRVYKGHHLFEEGIRNVELLHELDQIEWYFLAIPDGLYKLHN